MMVEILMRALLVMLAVGVGLPLAAFTFLLGITALIETGAWVVWRLRGYDYRWGQIVDPVRKEKRK